MSNYLITYSPLDGAGFSNYFYWLEDSGIDIAEIEHYLTCAVIIPYDYKNVIEPKCFDKKTEWQHPVILPVKEKIKIERWEDLRHLFSEETDVYNGEGHKERVSYEDYYKVFQKIQKYLKWGDIYEMNYCIPFVYKNAGIPVYDVFVELVEKMRSPFSALLKYGDWYIMSFSPERFLKKEKNWLYTEPIKGTAPRGNTSEEDERNKKQLQSSIKERTENVMTVDVCRNDLSRLAIKGSVRVEEIYSIKTYANVHQMISKVVCELKEDLSFKDIIHATFPMASMTGAPKIRAMQIGDEMELLPREFYSGCLGIYENGDFNLSVLIRSIFYNRLNREIRVWAGSAITIYADPYSEYKECVLKAERILHAVEKYMDRSKI